MTASAENCRVRAVRAERERVGRIHGLAVSLLDDNNNCSYDPYAWTNAGAQRENRSNSRPALHHEPRIVHDPRVSIKEARTFWYCKLSDHSAPARSGLAVA